MNILHINTNDLRGGAAKIPFRLMYEQNSMGYKSKMLVGYKELSSLLTFSFDIKSGEKQNLAEQGYQYYDLAGSLMLHENPLVQQADIVHIHNLHGNYFNPWALSYLSHLKPIVWSLHDMHSVTGHCGYSYECERWKSGCGNCPNLIEYPRLEKDRTFENLKEKQLIYAHSKLFIVPTAQWIGNIAEEGILQGHPMEVILNGVNLESYKPMDKYVVREKYGIPHNRVIIGAVANGGTFGQERKGGKYVQAVVDRLVEAGHDVLLINVGGEKQGYENDHLYHVGYLSTEQEMAEVYNTFDLYLFPSIADTCPLVISEGMACGIPIVTFDTGGIPELVQHGETGFVAPQKNVELLYDYTERLVKDVDLRQSFSKASRSYCATHFDHKLVTKKYLDVYEKAIKHFEERKNETLTFDLQIVPDVVKDQKEFQLAEKVKVEGYQIQKVVNPVVAAVIDGNEDISDADVIFVIRNQFQINEGYFDTMLYKGMNTDVLTSTVLLKRMNNKSFFKLASPVQTMGKLIDTSFGGIFYSKLFFEANKEAILRGGKVEYQSTESFVTENVQISLDDFIQLKVNGPVYIYGAGAHTIELLQEIPFLHENVLGIIDRNPQLLGQKLLNQYDVISLDCIEGDAPILISSASYEQEIYEQLSISVKNQLIKIYN